MDVVDIWTGRRATALQQAWRLTNEDFAARLGTAVRTVAKWNANPATQQGRELQEALDTVLKQAPDDVRARFAKLVDADAPEGAPETSLADQSSEPNHETVRRLTSDPNLSAAVEWIARQTGRDSSEVRREIASRADRLTPEILEDRRHRRGMVDQRQLANALVEYYSERSAGTGAYSARVAENELMTSLLTRPEWLDLACPLDPDHDLSELSADPAPHEVEFDALAADRAVQRMAEIVVDETTLVNAPLYQLIDSPVASGNVQGTFAVTEFVRYALTMDLLEGELLDALAEGRSAHPGDLPLRNKYLPDAATVPRPQDRLCAGGPLALCAIARPARGSRRTPDYLLLVQERGGSVLNAARRIAPIPKCFHEPLGDYREDTQLGLTLEREMEEELFGRSDVDSTASAQRSADPMHPSRLSGPMRWLDEHRESNTWQLECTGLGFNLVSGNYEFASLVVVHDEEFWRQYGGEIEANWESSRLQQYSSADTQLLTELACDPAWSNEGLFAFLQALRRLEQLNPERVNAPSIEWEVH
ncbi:hypothetical protein GCM10027174_45750 [Salinifilum aidingensis]